MRTVRLLVLAAALIPILLGCGDETTGPADPGPDPDPDLTPPSVSMALPASDAELRGRIELRAGAADNVGVTGVQFLVDGEPYRAEIGLPPYRTLFNTADVADGPHIIAARARDAAGLTTVSEPITVNVYNDPGIIELTIESLSGLNDLDGFELYSGNQRLRDISGTGTFTVTGVSAGTHRLRLSGLPPFCGADEQTVKVRSDAPASATFRIGCVAEAANGWVLISRSFGGLSQLSALSLRTGKLTVLVPDLDGLGAVSRDGSRLAYTDGGTLMIGDLDAFAPAAVASVPGAREVSWSPDGSALVVAAGEDWVRDLFIVNADGTNLHPVFDAPGFRVRPVWSATGRIAYEAIVGGPFNDLTSIASADAEGTNELQVTPGLDDFWPAWSPDGSRLAFTRISYAPPSAELQLAVVNADGTGLQRVTAVDAIGHPVWSPDAEWIVHSSGTALRATHVSGAPTLPVADFPGHALAWVAGSRFD